MSKAYPTSTKVITMDKINAADAQIQFSELLTRIGQGEEIIIESQGKAIALLSPYHSPQPKQRIMGRLQGQATIPDDFNATDDELIDLFEGKVQ